MKRLIASPFLFLVACGSSTTAPPDAGADAVVVDVSVDAPVDGNTPYEQAVLAAEWTKLTTGPSVGGGAKQDDIFFLDAMTGYTASGPDYAIWETTNGGTSWTSVFNKTGTYFRSIAFLDAQHGFAGNLGAGLTPQITDTNVLYGTANGGSTWSAVTTITGPAASGICNLTIIDSTHLVAVGRTNGPANMLVSSDAGATWTSLDLSAQFSMLIDARFTSPTDGILVGMNQSSVCSVFQTTDGGQTLNQVFASTTPNSLCWKISFSSDLVGYLAIQDTTVGPPTFAKTMDGGTTWTELPLPAQGSAKTAYPAIGIGFITDNVGWVSPDDPTLPTYRTSDGGNTWTVDPTLQSPINRFRFVDMNTAYAIGAAVWKLSITF